MPRKGNKSIVPLESHISNAICEYLEAKGYCFWRSNNIPTFSIGENGTIRMRSLPKYTPKGLPDITLILKGIYWGIEVKRPNMNQSPEQKEVEIWIKQNGGCYHVVRSLDDIIKLGF